MLAALGLDSVEALFDDIPEAVRTTDLALPGPMSELELSRELAALAGETELLYAPGYTLQPGFDQSLIDEAVQVAQQAEAAVLYIAISKIYQKPVHETA